MIIMKTIAGPYSHTRTVKKWKTALACISAWSNYYDHVSIRAGSYGTVAIVVFE